MIRHFGKQLVSQLKGAFISLLLCVMALTSFKSLLASDVCAHLVGDCDYYSCLDQKHLTCGDKGYALGYGQKFCQKFAKTHFPEPKHSVALSKVLFPAEGNEWVAKVRSCLQQALEDRLASSPFSSCSELRAFGFASHPSCYTTSPSFCELTPQNVSRVGLVIGIPTLITAESTMQIRQTAQICVDQLGSRIKAEGNPAIKRDLRLYQGLWQVLALSPTGFGRFMDAATRHHMGQ